MTELMRRALAEIEKLPADAQDAVATRILADLADDHAWEAQFEATSDNQWTRLAEMARREMEGDTISLEAAFPVNPATMPPYPSSPHSGGSIYSAGTGTAGVIGGRGGSPG
jgi:hypothetical protein